MSPFGGGASPNGLAAGEVDKAQLCRPTYYDVAGTIAGAASAPAEDDGECEGCVDTTVQHLQAATEAICSFGMDYSLEELADLGGNESSTHAPPFLPAISTGGTGGTQHHLLRHSLPEEARGEGALYHFGSVSVAEASKAIKKMSQRELQAKFRAVYNSVTNSNNNNWLRRKLFEAIGLDPTKGTAKKAAAGVAPKRRRVATNATRGQGGGRGAAGRRAAAVARAAATVATARAPSLGSWATDEDASGGEADDATADDGLASALLALGEAADMLEAEESTDPDSIPRYSGNATTAAAEGDASKTREGVMPMSRHGLPQAAPATAASAVPDLGLLLQAMMAQQQTTAGLPPYPFSATSPFMLVGLMQPGAAAAAGPAAAVAVAAAQQQLLAMMMSKTFSASAGAAVMPSLFCVPAVAAGVPAIKAE